MSVVIIRLNAIDSATGWVGGGNTNDLYIVGSFAFTSNAREIGLPGATTNHNVVLSQAGFDELVSKLDFIAKGYVVEING